MIFHLALASEWKAGWSEGRYTPARFAADAFVHCCDDEATTLQVASAYFSGATEPVLVAELDESALDVEVKREAPAPPDGKKHAHHTERSRPSGGYAGRSESEAERKIRRGEATQKDGRRFPHVFGSIPARAVVRLGSLVRDGASWRWPSEWAYGKP